MNSFARRAALLSAALIAAFACRGTRVHDATFAGTSVDLQYDLPREITSTTEFCAGAHSILVSLDTTSGSGAQFSTLLFGTDGTLKGCGKPACRNDVDLVFTGLKRVIVEWTDVTPAQYENSFSANVVCRGVATDETNGTGAIPPFGGLSRTTDSAGVSHFHARLPVLRVGDLNPLFTTTAGAIVAPWAAASGFQSDLSGARTGTGGKIVVAGGGIPGSALKNTWIFDPRSISGSAGPDLGHVRIGLTAIRIR